MLILSVSGERLKGVDKLARTVSIKGTNELLVCLLSFIASQIALVLV